MNTTAPAQLFRPFRSLLVANRGEIACRVMRTARGMGLRTIAVYSDADRDALHVTTADQAVRIGTARAAESYLDIAAILDAARASGAEAVHPGYGFLSESAEFARACAGAGLVFVGPSPEMIEAMGSKSRAKALMENAGVPLVPGYHGDAQDDATLIAASSEIGFPVLIKASAGGGGRGMRVVREASALTDAIAGARRESKAAFGDDRLLVEKYVENPRHIEVQIVGDSHGNLVSLFERECTLQRRHQKVIEEAPSPTLNDAQRAAVAEAARKAAGAIGYVGAGTIEFVSDGRNVFFIEMNTRLQVEHPVTELVTGIDLVEWQLRIAFGETLPLRQDEIRLRGHAVEARIYAEDPARNFMPSVGLIKQWQVPEQDRGLRIDAGYRTGTVVSSHYDAMLAKMIAFAPDRATSLDRLARALDETDVHGVTTNLSFLSRLLRHDAVRANRIDTGFIERELTALTSMSGAISPVEIAASVATIVLGEVRESQSSPWFVAGWMPVGRRRRGFTFRDAAGQPFMAHLVYGRGGTMLEIGGSLMAFAWEADEAGLSVTLDGFRSKAVVFVDGADIFGRASRGRFALTWVDPFRIEQSDARGEDRIVAPLPGTVVAVFAAAGAVLEKGAPVLTLEVMKMEHVLRAPFAGVLKRLAARVGDVVAEGAELAEVEPTA